MKKEGEREKRRKRKRRRLIASLTMIITKRAARTKAIAMTSKMATVAVTMKTVTRMMVMTMT